MSYRHSSYWDFGGTEEPLCHGAEEEFSGGYWIHGILSYWIHGVCSPPHPGGNYGHMCGKKDVSHPGTDKISYFPK